MLHRNCTLSGKVIVDIIPESPTFFKVLKKLTHGYATGQSRLRPKFEVTIPGILYEGIDSILYAQPRVMGPAALKPLSTAGPIPMLR